MLSATIKLLCLLSCLLLIGCSEQSNNKVLRVSHNLNVDHSVHRSIDFMAERLKHYSNGTLTVKIYPNSQLGSEREMVELLQIGSLAMAKVSAAALEGFVPEMKLFSVPYIFRSRSHRWQVLQGEVGQQILASTKKAHIFGLGYFDAGSRSFYTCDSMVTSPADLIGKKIRVMKSQTAVRMVGAFGGSATPISSGEIYAALQQGVVDGAENNPPTFYLSRHYEICPNYSLNEHTSVPDVVVVSQHIFNSLSKNEKNWLEKAMAEAVDFQKSLWLDAENEALTAMKEAGVNIITPDKTSFMKAVIPFHTSYQGTVVGDYINRIKAVKAEVKKDE